MYVTQINKGNGQWGVKCYIRKKLFSNYYKQTVGKCRGDYGAGRAVNKKDYKYIGPGKTVEDCSSACNNSQDGLCTAFQIKKSNPSETEEDKITGSCWIWKNGFDFSGNSDSRNVCYITTVNLENAFERCAVEGETCYCLGNVYYGLHQVDGEEPASFYSMIKANKFAMIYAED